MKITKTITLLTICLGLSLFTFTGCHSPFGIPSWDECTKSSNWHGSNAQWRMMNMLSPHMPDSVFDQRMQFMKDRGCNTAHLFICNKSDGEYGGYSIYGGDITWNVNKNFTGVMEKRIKKLRSKGYGIVLWLMADDSSAWNRKLASNPQRYIDDIASLGWFKYASTICIGLELDEYLNSSQVNGFATALRSKYKGKIATHHTSGNAQFVGFGDILFYQIAPTDNQSTIASASKKALSHGKPVNFFESYRCENRKNCETAMKNGCYAVGNW